MKYQFDLAPSILDEIKGNIIRAKKSEFERLVDTFKSAVKENDELKEKYSILEEENKKLKKENNQKIISNEVGYGKLVAKLEEENKILKSKLDNLYQNLKAMEKLYLDEIKELKDKLKNCNNISDVIKKTIHNELSKISKEPMNYNFEIKV